MTKDEIAIKAHKDWQGKIEVVARAKEPTIMDDGVIVSKKMATKTDKKLQNVGIGFFTHEGIRYVCVKLIYERFDIIEIFILT